MVGWSTDYVILGWTARGWGLLGLRVLGALAVVPLLAATRRSEPPVWLGKAELLVCGAYPLVYEAVFALKPTNLAVQGGLMVLLWLLFALVIEAPLRGKLLVGLSTVGLYLGQLAYLWGRLGPAYGKPNELITIWLLGVFIVLGLSWVPHYFGERRLREFLVNERLRHEVALRESRERDLELARAQAEQAAREAQKAATKAEFENRMRAMFVANISHDLRTPMAGILGLIELLRETPLNGEQSSYVETIHASNQTLLALLNDILDFSRIEDGKLPLARASTPLGKALRGPIELLRPTAARKGVELRVELARDLPEHGLLDAARVQQIVLNLLGNAIKFTERGSVTVRATPGQHQGKPTLRVEVVDTGIGFTAEQRDRLFRRFSQADEAVGKRFGGTGLGLAISKGLVELMGGTIDAESEPGQGATFRFEIPVEPAAPAASSLPPAAPPRLRVLLAEDNTINQLVLMTMLKKLGQSAVCVGNGQQALASLAAERFDLVLMDVQMPILDGIEATRRLRAAAGPNQQTVVVALTAGATSEEQATYQASGFDGLYSKPIDLDTLRGLLAREGARALQRWPAGLAGEAFRPRLPSPPDGSERPRTPSNPDSDRSRPPSHPDAA